MSCLDYLTDDKLNTLGGAVGEALLAIDRFGVCVSNQCRQTLGDFMTMICKPNMRAPQAIGTYPTDPADTWAGE